MQQSINMLSGKNHEKSTGILEHEIWRHTILQTRQSTSLKNIQLNEIAQSYFPSAAALFAFSVAFHSQVDALDAALFDAVVGAPIAYGCLRF